jgi:molybdopterin molybdotransferase
MKGFARLTPIKEALSEFFAKVNVGKLQSVEVPLHAATGRALSKDLICPRDVPSFDRSAVDGYAIRAEDVYGASETNPIVLSVKGISRVGNPPPEILAKREAMKIATGAPIPHGADAVVMVEFTEITGPGKVEVYRSLTPGENVSAKGEDVKEGQLILRAGTFLKPQDIGIIAALGLPRVEVSRKPVIAVLSTGNELVDLGSETPSGKIVDSNRPTLLAMVEASGAEPVDLGIAPDERNSIIACIEKGLAQADVILASGGTSVGERDLLPDVVNSLGEPGVIVHGIAMRPGRPVALCAVKGKPIVLLPGFPVAAMIAFDVFVEPIIMRMLGASTRLCARATVKAEALRRVPSSPGNRSFVRVLVMKSGERTVFEPIRSTGSGVISSMVKANGMLVIPENKEGVEEGEMVNVVLLRSLEEN